jgi:hypothetical protein
MANYLLRKIHNFNMTFLLDLSLKQRVGIKITLQGIFTTC